MASLESFGLDSYQPTAFYFKVTFAATLGLSDTSFQEVSGIKVEIETESYTEGGENRYIHQLPKAAKSSNLVLKRGISAIDSALYIWCKAVFEGGFLLPITPMPVFVYLMNDQKIPVRSWCFANAYPVSWEADPFNSTKNEVAIEKIELSYSYFTRLT